MKSGYFNDGMEKIRYALEHGKRLEITLPAYTMEERKYLDFLLGLYLEACGLSVLHDRLLYCLHEIGGNAHKANLKRVFLEEYEDMSLFKDLVSKNLGRYNRRLEQRGNWIRFRFHLKEDTFILQVINNEALLPEEAVRIREKLAIASRYQSLSDAYPAAEDFSEGAGLGIVMIHVILKGIGFSEFSYSVETKKNSTVSSLSLNVATCSPISPSNTSCVGAEH